MLTPNRFASTLALSLALGVVALLPNDASAQSVPGTIIIEGTLTFGAPAAAPQVVMPAAPPLIMVAPPAATVPVRALASVPASAQGESLEVRTRTRRRWGLVGAGAGLAVGAYALNLVGSLLWMMVPTGVADASLLVPTWNGHREEFLLWSLVPVVGPLAQMGYTNEEWQIPLLALSSGLEIAGFIMAIVGTATRETGRGPGAAPAPAVSVVPYASAAGAGLSVAGTF